jgi:SAM-dependent methyltransferase
MGSFYRQQLETYLKTLDIKADLLYDIGGKQKSVQGRTKSWDVKKIVCLDIPEYDLNYPQEVKEPADVIMCLEVFEYIFNPAQAFLNLAQAMKKSGRAIVSFPFVYPLHNEVEYDSLRYTITGIKRLAAYAGLTIVKVTPRKTKTGTLVKYYAEDGMRPAKDHDHNITGYIIEFTK